ncbi:MAG: MBL fold metallo-hydrolase [Rubricoccaceae bacterium]|nr:MBL fold metallo-hydrolase [Rubricoccaceae bacterium]
MLFRQIFDPHLAQYAYLIGCQRTKEALIIDPQRDIDRYIDAAKEEGLRITAVAETHIHADYLSGVREFVARGGVEAYVSDEGDADWKYEWAKDAGSNVHLVHDGDTFKVGNIKLEVIHTPGHTPEHICFLLTDEGGGASEPMGLISGDFVFVGDLGRPDLLETAAGNIGAREPSARALYESVQHLNQMPGYLQIWPGHGAGSACGKALGSVPQSTLGYEMLNNASILAATSGEQNFVDFILEGQPEPPLYFARMKKENKLGPAILGKLPQPGRISVENLAEAAGNQESVVLDTRPRSEFFNGHLAGSLLAPFGKSLPTVAGSYILPEQTIYLVAEEENIDAIVRDLIRIGLDNIGGFVTPEDLENADLTTTEVIDFADVVTRRANPATVVVDVRKQDEVDRGMIEGAVHIPHVRLLERMGELPKDKTLLVHCQSGVRSAVASALLSASGFNAVYVNDHFRNAKDVVDADKVVA